MRPIGPDGKEIPEGAVAAYNCYIPLDLSKGKVADWVADLQTDIDCAERQAANGPYFPEKGITKESLLAYAADCRKKLENPKASLYEALKGSG